MVLKIVKNITQTLQHGTKMGLTRIIALFLHVAISLPSITLTCLLKSNLVALMHTGPGTGVPFHIHGATYAELIYGRKVKKADP